MTCEDQTMNWTLIFEGLVALASIIAIIVSCKALKRSDKANVLAERAIKVSESQESGQKEKRDELRESLDICSEKLTAMEDVLSFRTYEIDPGEIKQSISVLDSELPETEPLHKTAKAVSNKEVREAAVSALHSVEGWRQNIWGVFSVISELPGASVDERASRDSALMSYAISRKELLDVSWEFKASIEDAVAAIDRVESGE